jgi:hypothetical protein
LNVAFISENQMFIPEPVEIVWSGIAGSIFPLRNGNPVPPKHWKVQNNKFVIYL